LKRTILSTADVARLFNVTETTVKRWADDGTLKCQKTPGGHRKYPIRHVIEFSTANNFEPVGALSVSPDDRLGHAIQAAVLEKEFPTLVDAFVTKALSTDCTDLYEFLSYLYQHKLELWEIHDLVLRPGMREIGERWARGEIGVNHEHRATYETLDALAKLQAEILVKPSNGKRALCACPGSELHDLGLRCIAYLLEAEGWSVHYLGAHTPVEAICAAIRELAPAVVCLSVTVPPMTVPSMTVPLITVPNAASTAPAPVDEVAAEVARVGGSLLIGGQGASDVPQRCPVCSSSLDVLRALQHPSTVA
jgi:methanogenic corrinoid protein MtbC1